MNREVARMIEKGVSADLAILLNWNFLSQDDKEKLTFEQRRRVWEYYSFR